MPARRVACALQIATATFILMSVVAQTDHPSASSSSYTRGCGPTSFLSADFAGSNVSLIMRDALGQVHTA